MSVVRALEAEGQFECVLGVNPGFQARKRPTLPTFELPPIGGGQIGLRTVWRGRTVARVAKEWLRAAPQRIFHGQSRTGLVVALWLASAGERRVLASVHCYGRQRWFYRCAARRLGERLYWLSPAMKNYYGVDAGGSWAQCIPGCMPSSTGVSAGASRFEAPHGVTRLGGVGGLVAWKRWDLVLEALSRLPEAVRGGLRFQHIGGPDGSAGSARCAIALRAQTVALGLESIVEWRGPQPTSEIFLRGIDYLIVASEREPFSVAMLESLAAGVPVLAADSGGARDVVIPGENGWLFKSGDPDKLAEIMTKVVAIGARQELRVNQERLRPFTASVVAKQWAQVYSRLLTPD